MREELCGIGDVGTPVLVAAAIAKATLFAECGFEVELR